MGVGGGALRHAGERLWAAGQGWGKGLGVVPPRWCSLHKARDAIPGGLQERCQEHLVTVLLEKQIWKFWSFKHGFH